MVGLDGIDVVVEADGLHSAIDGEHLLVEGAQNLLDLGHGCLEFHFEDNLADIHLLHACHHGAFGSQHTVAEGLPQQLAVAHSQFTHDGIVAMPQVDVDDAHERRVTELAAVM